MIHGNQTSSVPDAYKRYLENRFIKALRLEGTPVRLEFKTSENPYKDKKNKLTERQLDHKQRQTKIANKGKALKKGKKAQGKKRIR